MKIDRRKQIGFGSVLKSRDSGEYCDQTSEKSLKIIKLPDPISIEQIKFVAEVL